jgi:hypothetical protein
MLTLTWTHVRGGVVAATLQRADAEADAIVEAD